MNRPATAIDPAYSTSRRTKTKRAAGRPAAALLVAFSLLLTGCASANPSVAPPSPTAQPTATATPSPGPTATVASTATPTVMPTEQATPSAAPSPASEEMYSISNGSTVQNGPSVPTTFSITVPWLVTDLVDYHWNNGQGGQPVGTISLLADDGTTYGPWQASGQDGQGGVPNAYWIAHPNIVLPAGSYTVIDSNPATWAQNSGTGGAGMSWGAGMPQAAPPASASPSPATQQMYSVLSLGVAYNGAAVPTTFSITTPWLVTEIIDYHWNNGQGARPVGTVGLRADDGTTYGPWQATSQPGQGGVPDAYWVVNPNVVIPAGTYTVLDSEPGTWAQNAETGGAGMSWGSGIPQG
jgi:hypothetical protein